MDESGGQQIAAKRAKRPKPPADDGGKDRLSELHDDHLLRILALLDTTEVARTSVLARRWRSLWRSLPEVRFNLASNGDLIRDVLDDAPDPDDDAPAAIRRIAVTSQDAGPGFLAAWLPSAARRLVGELLYRDVIPGSTEEDSGSEEEEDGEEERGLVELPCFEKATKIELKLRYQDLAFPPRGVFRRLTTLFLSRVRFHDGACNLGDAVSEPRCPGLKKLGVANSGGLDSLSIHSKSLIKIKLTCLGSSVQQLTIVAPNLKKLGLVCCLFDDAETKPVANISAPQIVTLMWADAYDPESVHLGDLGQLQHLRTKLFGVYGAQHHREQNQSLRFLRQFKVLHSLKLMLINQPDADGYHYLLGNITVVLPQIMCLHLVLLTDGHAFGANLFHVLRMCSGLTRLLLEFYTDSELEAQTVCEAGCICDEQETWKTKELPLNHLQEVEINGLRGSQHEVIFVKQVFNWAKALKKLKLTFSSSMSNDMANELCQVFLSFSRPEICMIIYMQEDV